MTLVLGSSRGASAHLDPMARPTPDREHDAHVEPHPVASESEEHPAGYHITATKIVEVEVPEGLPVARTVPCCPRKPSCGNTTVHLTAQVTDHDDVLFTYLRDNDDPYLSLPPRPAEALIEMFDKPDYQPWPEPEEPS